MKTVMTTGTFDILHYGHIAFLQAAAAQGDRLIVGVNVTPEGKTPYYSYEERALMLQNIRCVDKVVPLYKQGDKFKFLHDEHVDIFVCGEEYRDYYDIPHIQACASVVFIPRTPNISTTQLKKYFTNQHEFNTIVIDMDDTICFTSDRQFDQSTPNQKVIDQINAMHDKGWHIVIATARGAKTCKTVKERIEKYDKVTREWLINHGVAFDELLFGKPNADFYVDDKNMSINDFLNFKGA